MLERGARALADHLGFDAARLECLVKDRLLVLAQRWSWRVKQRNRWIADAYPHLQKDIYLAVHWLCMLTGNTLDHYLDLWRYSYLGQQSWAELKSVLPFEYYEIRDKFLKLAPFYITPFNEHLTERHKLAGNRLLLAVDAVRTKSRHFNVFMGAFKKLHAALGSARNPSELLDFREVQPLDYYLLLAIKAEIAFREELQSTGELDNIRANKQGMRGYLKALGSRAGLHHTTLTQFDAEAKKLAQLHGLPSDAIRRIKTLQASPDKGQNTLVQAMVCCEVARNYFAHHDYLDSELLNSADSQLLLGGILVSVLVLLSVSA